MMTTLTREQIEETRNILLDRMVPNQTATDRKRAVDEVLKGECMRGQHDPPHHHPRPNPDHLPRRQAGDRGEAIRP
jgi:hypothetical protein